MQDTDCSRVGFNLGNNHSYKRIVSRKSLKHLIKPLPTTYELKKEEEHSLNQDSSFDSPSHDEKPTHKEENEIKVCPTNESLNARSESAFYKILIVDDDKFCQKQVGTMLKNIIKAKNLKFDVIFEDDGLGTINQVFQDRSKGLNLIKLIISDETMNYINGSQSFCTLSILESKGAVNKVKKALLTAIEDEGTLRYLKNISNADSVFKKPITKSTLEELILSIK